MPRTVALCGVALALAAVLETGDSAGTSAVNPNEAPPKSGDARWLHYLETVSGWIMQRHLATDNLTHSPDWPPGELQTSIFINGNLARILLATASLTHNSTYADEALRWCDKLCEQQASATTPTGHDAGYWGVGYGGVGPGNLGSVYFGDTGTAVTTLAMCFRVATQSDRTARYLSAMQRYARFVREGNKNPLVGRGAAAPNGWVIKTGEDKGAIGCGYYAKHLSTLPYVIATGTTGGAFFAELANVTVDAADREGLFSDAHAAMLWTAGVVLPSGEIPYILDGKTDTKTWPLDTIAYVTEGIVGLDTYYPAAHADLAKQFESTVKYLVATQLANGSWGELRSADQQRSARVLTLLSWWVHVQARMGRTDANVTAAVDKYLAFLWADSQNPGSRDYGVGGFSPKVLLHTTSFVGLAVADSLSFGITF